MINKVVLTGMKQQCMWSPHIQNKVTSDRLYVDDMQLTKNFF